MNTHQIAIKELFGKIAVRYGFQAMEMFGRVDNNSFSKEFATAVGVKVATVTFAENKNRAVLFAEYQSEGRNILETVWGWSNIREDQPAHEHAMRIEDGFCDIDKKIADSYAMRLRNSESK